MSTSEPDSEPSTAAPRQRPWWLSPRRIFRQVLMLEDSHHAKALGVAIGMFVGMTPTVGLQIVIVLTIAVLTRRLFYFNVPAAIITVYVSNPVTVVPIYWLDYQVGKWFFAAPANAPDFHSILQYNSWEAWWEALVTLLVRIGPPLIVGSLVVASVCGLLAYPAMRWILLRLDDRKARRKPDQPA